MLVYLTTFPLLSRAQNTKISMPETEAAQAIAKNLLLSADRMNSLKGADLKPWRIKATYQATDEYGKHVSEGSIEEIWAGEHKIRLSYLGKNFLQNVYITDRGVLISGVKDLPVDWLALVQSQFIDPLYDAAFLEKQDLEVQQRQIGNTKLNCIAVKASESLKELPGLLGVLSCVTPELSILRISVAGNKMPQVVRNNPIKFQGRYIPQDIRIILAGKNRIVAHLESAELLDAVNSQDFDPPSDAFLQPKRITVSESEADAHLLYFVGSSTPLKITAAFVPAYMQIAIGEDGHVISADIINALSIETDFRMSILNAVRRWKYKPFIVNGVPVEVNTTKFIMNIR